MWSWSDSNNIIHCLELQPIAGTQETEKRAEQDVTTDEEPSVGLKEGHMNSNMKEKVNHKSFITNLYVINTDWKNKF